MDVIVVVVHEVGAANGPQFWLCARNEFQVINRARSVQCQIDLRNAINVDIDRLNAAICAARNGDFLDQLTIFVQQTDPAAFFSVQNVDRRDKGRCVKLEPDGTATRIVVWVRAVIVFGDDQNIVARGCQVCVATGWVRAIKDHRIVWRAAVRATVTIALRRNCDTFELIANHCAGCEAFKVDANKAFGLWLCLGGFERQLVDTNKFAVVAPRAQLNPLAVLDFQTFDREIAEIAIV